MDTFLSSAPVVAVNDAVVQFLNTQENPVARNVIEKVEQSTGLKREKAFYLATLVGFSIIVFFSLGQMLVGICGLSLPLHYSLRSVRNLKKSKVNIGSKSTEDVCKWVIYWCIFGLFSTIELANGMAGSSGLVQLYLVFKCILLVLLYFPTTNGAMVLYDAIIDPALTRLEAASGKKTN